MREILTRSISLDYQAASSCEYCTIKPWGTAKVRLNKRNEVE